MNDAVERGLINEREKRVNAYKVDAMEFSIVDERRKDEGTLLFEGKGIANSEAWGRHRWRKLKESEIWVTEERESGNWQREEERNESLY